MSKAISLVQCLSGSGQRTGGYTWAVPAAKRGLKLVAAGTYDLLLSRALPPEAHLAAYIVARKTGIPWIANWNDPTPYYMFPEPYVNGNNGRRQMMKFWERRFFQAVADKAAWHTFPCTRLQSYVFNYLPGDIAAKSSIIPHVAIKRYAKKNGIQSRFTLLYAGSLRFPRDPKPLLQGIKMFCDRLAPDEKISVRFITDCENRVAETIRSYFLEGIVQLEPMRPYDEMMRCMTSADVLVVLEADVKEGIFLPSKFVDYVQTGRPILAVSPKVGTLADIISTYGGGVAADITMPESIASSIGMLYEYWRSGVLDEHFSSERLFCMFDRDKVLGAYLDIFEKIH
jgi:hypothetical protein